MGCTYVAITQHNYRRGLLTRRQLSDGPEFGITMAPASALDSFNIVFGRVLEGYEVVGLLIIIIIIISTLHNTIYATLIASKVVYYVCTTCN